MLMGTGDDTRTVNSTAADAITLIHGGGGSDTITVLDHTGPLVVFGDTSANNSRYASTPASPTGTAYAFSNYGDDIINASAASGTVVIDGGDGNDILTGSQGGDHIAGGAGTDEIRGQSGSDHIFGD